MTETSQTTHLAQVTSSALAVPGDPFDVVREFVAALQEGDIEICLSHLHEDVVFHPAPLPPVHGKAAVARQLQLLRLLARRISIQTHNIAANGGVVLTERTHTIELGPIPVDFWTWGTFELVDGKIALWRERFDIAELSFAAARGIAQAATALQIESRRG
ncbi:limonene-1,2-epoxide hydrolase family protein [Hoyosella altamirensis]|uniref:Limonene-1,2-epoxide hydrolase n=1 Tax=Hoyosella altamirensis TaxID=616997 RepID=A0A839RRM4_9ACTN|nr:limonene-1,2-epoxide hydrolase family protein [Hoyosella altamirensis]MBB3038754.1 limonene-1,2-epoxide hydrolase [Hoyosella altamirensis]